MLPVQSLTFPVASKVKSRPPSVCSTRYSTIDLSPRSLGLTKSANHQIKLISLLTALTGPKLLGPLLFSRIGINGKDPLALLRSSALQDGETDTSDTENGNVGVFDSWGFGKGTVTCGDAASEETGLLKGSLGADCNDGEFGNDSVLREGRASHLM